MFYEPEKNDHGLPFTPFKSIVAPRAIGWISTLSTGGVVNLAPFSQFTNLGADPPYVMFSAALTSGRFKDSVRNVLDTGEFVANMATYDLREAVNLTSSSVDPEVDEAALAGLEMEPSVLVKPPRVKASPAHLECRFHTSVTLPGQSQQMVVIGKVVGVHIRDDALTPDGKLDVARVKPLARLGYHDYTAVTEVFAMRPPEGAQNAQMRQGLAGRRSTEGEGPDFIP